MNDCDIDNQAVKAFWDKRAEMPLSQEQINFTSLNDKLGKEKYEYEKKKLKKIIRVRPTDTILDLGAGWGRLIMQLNLHKRAEMVMAVDYCEGLTRKGNEYFESLGIRNVIFETASAGDFKSITQFDTIIISGVLLFLNDDEIERLIKNIRGYSRIGTRLYLRDNTGMNGRYVIKEKYSEELKTNYNAIYRSREELIDIFKRAGFDLIKDEDMFPEGSILNRRKETRSRLYIFERK